MKKNWKPAFDRGGTRIEAPLRAARRRTSGSEKQCNKLAHLLEHAVWEEDMIAEEPIVFNGLTADFVELIGPLLMSRKWTVNGRHDVQPFLRSLDSVFHIRYDPEKDYLALGRLDECRTGISRQSPG